MENTFLKFDAIAKEACTALLSSGMILLIITFAQSIL